MPAAWVRCIAPATPVSQQAGYQYAVTQDGQRFLVNTAAAASLAVTVVSDWTLALKK